jgi:hypothetical protein
MSVPISDLRMQVLRLAAVEGSFDGEHRWLKIINPYARSREFFMAMREIPH